jgi:hypothetical protein
VYFSGVVVAVGGSRRGSRRLARDGNAFLRSLQTRPVVDQLSMLQQFESYLVLASDPLGQFRPVMNSLWPHA